MGQSFKECSNVFAVVWILVDCDSAQRVLM
jgi:hypothetical protein